MLKSKQSLTQASRYLTNARTELEIIQSTHQPSSDALPGFHDNLRTAEQHMRFSNVSLQLEQIWNPFFRFYRPLKHGLITTTSSKS